MQSESREELFKLNLKVILFFIVAIFFVTLVFLRNSFFQSTFLLKSFGEISVDPEIAFKNDKPTFLEFYAEWCEVCKEMAPKISALKDEYEKDIRKFNVNGIPQVNLFDKKGNLKSTFIGKQEETTIRESVSLLEKEIASKEEVLNSAFSLIKENRNNEISPRNHG